MKRTRKKDDISIDFSERLNRYLECSPKTGLRTTYKMLAETLGIKQQSVSSWANGITTPELKHIIPIADYFGVTCEELLRDIKPDNLDIHKRLDISDKIIVMLENMKSTHESLGNFFLNALGDVEGYESEDLYSLNDILVSLVETYYDYTITSTLTRRTKFDKHLHNNEDIHKDKFLDMDAEDILDYKIHIICERLRKLFKTTIIYKKDEAYTRICKYQANEADE